MLETLIDIHQCIIVKKRWAANRIHVPSDAKQNIVFNTNTCDAKFEIHLTFEIIYFPWISISN